LQLFNIESTHHFDQLQLILIDDQSIEIDQSHLSFRLATDANIDQFQWTNRRLN